jgi:protease-4
VVVVATRIVVGLVVAPHAFSAVAEPSGTVAVVPLEGGIDGGTAAGVAASLAEVRQDPSVDAVVVVSNSPGGGAAASERLYLEVARTAGEMPVVASVDATAASGAYYAIAPADHIYAKPASLVGSVGVFTTTPTEVQPIDEVIASGPDKLSGGDKREWEHTVESLRQAFVGGVFEQRGDALTLDRTELAEAGIYTGAPAVEAGLADDIGGFSAAVDRAAEAASVSDYDVEVLRPAGTARFLTRANFVASDAPDKRMVPPSYFVGDLAETPAAANVLMLPPSVVAAAIEESDAGTANESSTGESDARAAGVARPAGPRLPEVDA